MTVSIDHEELIRRLSRDLEDSYDEELELDRGPPSAARSRSDVGAGDRARGAEADMQVPEIY